ncbi:MAG: DUF4386 family protein [SAR202 cluster bacterium]|nr:DUF4386 family protein [SAR202 cluster bacterium]
MKLAARPQIIAGVLLLALAAVDAAWYFFWNFQGLAIDMPSLDLAAGTFQVIDENRQFYLTAVWFDFAWNLVAFLAGWALYLVLRRRSRRWALLGILGFVSGAVMFMLGTMALFGYEQLALQYASTSSFDVRTLTSTALALYYIQAGTGGLGAFLFSAGVASFSLAILLYHAGDGRWFGLLGLISAAILLATSTLYVPGSAYISYVATLWYALTGLWLILARGKPVESEAA